MSTQVLSKEVPIEEFVAGLRRFAEPAFSNVDQILGFVKSTPVAPDTLRPYLAWDRQHYTRNLIDKSPLYELVAICWEVGQVSSVHNHREQNCWMAVPIGRLMVENFRVLAQDLDAGKCRLEPSDTCEMNSAHPCAVDPLEPVHRVLNPRQLLLNLSCCLPERNHPHLPKALPYRQSRSRSLAPGLYSESQTAAASF